MIFILTLANTLPMDQQNFNDIVDYYQEVRIVETIKELAEWDLETYMPPDGVQLRTKQLSYLSGQIFEKKIDPVVGDKLGKLIDLETGEILATVLSDPQIAALVEWRKDYLHEKKLNKEFVQEFSALSAQAIPVWSAAKEEEDFASFAPYLEKIVRAMREKAELLGYEKHPYDALLNEYEPGMTTEKADRLFSTVKQPIIDLVRQKQTQQSISRIFQGDFDAEKQLALCKELLETMGLNFDRARLDRTHHPFTLTMHPHDIRLTVFNNPRDMKSVLASAIHEGGHSIYEQGLLAEHFGTPLASAVSTGIHESQSRFWETYIGLSQSFWQYLFPKLQENFPHHFQKVSLTDAYAEMTQVRPSLIRVESDELTYTLHIILRYEMEKELLAGQLSVRDIPQRWNEKMREYLGIEPERDSEGCLQDVHWSLGYFGYFPTYAFGNMYAAQLFHAFAKEHPDWEERVSQGEMHFIRDYLNEQVHQHGRRYSVEELLEKVTGEKLNSNYYIKHLQQRYGDRLNAAAAID